MSKCVIRSIKIWLKNLKSCFSMFYIRFQKKNFEKISESLIFAHVLFFGEWCEWIAHFAQIKWAMWANCSGRSPEMSDHDRFSQVTQKKWTIVSESLRSLIFWANRLDKKTSDSLGNQMSEFPALLNNYCILASYLEASVSCHILFTYAIYV